MQKGFAIIVLLCCAVLMDRANEAPPVGVNDVDINATERVLYCTDTVAALTSVCPVLRTAGGFGAQQKIKCCAAKQQMVRTISDDGAYCWVMDDGVVSNERFYSD
jgi:hypothetical protein